jgi:hypothetical protein
MYQSSENNANLEGFRRKGMGIGMILFTPFGIALWLTTGNPGLLGVGPAVGIPVGLSIGEAMYKRHIEQDKDAR